MKTPIEFINSEIIVQSNRAQPSAQTVQKSRPHIVAARAARRARRANH